MDLLMAIALLCQVNVGISKEMTDQRQLKCQQEYIKCYFDLGKSQVLPNEELKQKKFLYQCVLDRKIK